MNGEAIDKEGFHRLVTHYADLLKRSGAQPGDRILITVNISTKFYAMAVATLAIGKIIDSIPYGSVGYTIYGKITIGNWDPPSKSIM